MITFTTDGTKLVVDMETGDTQEPKIRLTWETARTLFAGLLRDRLREMFSAKVRAAREEAYLKGYSDGKNKRLKDDYFRSIL